MHLDKYIKIYDKRWLNSIETKDDNILVFNNPVNQVEFFYLNYNKIIETIIKKETKATIRINIKEKIKFLFSLYNLLNFDLLVTSYWALNKSSAI